VAAFRLKKKKKSGREGLRGPRFFVRVGGREEQKAIFNKPSLYSSEKHTTLNVEKEERVMRRVRVLIHPEKGGEEEGVPPSS